MTVAKGIISDALYTLRLCRRLLDPGTDLGKAPDQLSVSIPLETLVRVLQLLKATERMVLDGSPSSWALRGPSAEDDLGEVD